jgi:hypothetical protein
MTKRVFGFHTHKLGQPQLRVGLAEEQAAVAQPEPVAQRVEVAPSIFALSVPPKGGPPMVHRYANDDQGHRELANLVRGELILALIIGHEIEFEHASVVALLGHDVAVKSTTLLEKTN